MVRSLLPPDTTGGRQTQRFGPEAGPATIFNPWQWINGATITLTDGTNTLTLSATALRMTQGLTTMTLVPSGIVGTSVIVGTVGAATGGIPIVLGATGFTATAAEGYEQWGSSVVTLAGSPLQASITFPAAFPNTCDGVIVCNGDTGAQTTFVPGVHNPSTTGFTVVTLTSASAGGARVNWIAFGH